MKKAKIIIGKNGIVKSTYANAMCATYNQEEKVLIPGCNLRIPLCYSGCNENTKVVIIDDLQKPGDLIPIIFCTVDGLMVDRQSKEPFVINPEVIIVCDESITRELILDMGSSIARRIEIFEFSETESTINQ